jgi:hypothetical protein
MGVIGSNQEIHGLYIASVSLLYLSNDLLRKQEGNEVIDFLFAEQHGGGTGHSLAVTFSYESAWLHNGLANVFFGR